ncbi:hypothetical protein GCM10007103_32750 [Salinimicrobium marinum]|uniref:Histone deacetylase n=1 Tax=Salinimicrobium marinum TaxID=680283 RepID=A0A918SLH1_9FLAO|nr:hypothetical protein [Salinimicrobium marinum]GHA49373.1 hypothetical protein GCM10007103_32750 [Salinimicrobium marinum]
MKKNFNKLWYASYGSNLLEEWFSCYIGGGKPRGAYRTYPGCTDTTAPIASKPIKINTKFYFAKVSKTWSGGGPAFIKPKINENVSTLGRMNLITTEQFIELMKQEIIHEGNLTIDFDRAIKDTAFDLKRPESWYNKLLYLEKDEGYPIFTFTNMEFLTDEINPPNEHYLKIIIEGLKETYNLSPIQIEKYLRSKKGITCTEVEGQLGELIERGW